MTDVVEPRTTPAPASTDWVPIWGMGVPGGSYVPQPVVNGQWIKGVGGAAVWAPIAQADLPANLGAKASQVMPGTSTAITNWNDVLDEGWYTAAVAAGSPTGDSSLWLLVRVETHDNTPSNSWVTQTAWAFTDSTNFGPRTWIRRSNPNKVWGAWKAVPQMLGPFQVTSASFAAGNQGYTYYAHGLGITPRAVLATCRDGSWAHAAAFQVTTDATNVIFIMWVPSNAPGAVTQVYNFVIVI